MTREEAIKLIAKHCHKNYEELRSEIKNKNKVACLELLIMRVMESAIAKADIKKLDWIFYQLFGKPKDTDNENNRTIYLKYSLDNNGVNNGQEDK